jgi:tRNA(Ile)-lysidine synthase
MNGRPTGVVDRAVEAWLHTHATVGPVTVAVSGGADSLALALAVAAAGRAGRSITVDHGLQDGSVDRAATTATTVRGLGFDATVVRVDVTGPGGPEAAARRARYAALAQHAEGPVLLGHTMDDQAETVLLGLGRGSGPRSIAGMRAWTRPWGRPLLGVRRRDTVAACTAAGLTPWDDPHNADPTFTRVRLRHEVLPLLDQVLGGGVVPALSRTAELLADDLAALDAIAADALADATVDGGLRSRTVRSWPAAVRRRVLRSWAAGIGADPLTSDHLLRLDDLVTVGRDGAAVRLPGAVDAVLDQGRLVSRPVARPG